MKEMIFIMKNAKMNKHLSFEDRCVIVEYLNNNFNFTQIAQRISKYRTTIARDVKKHRFLRTTNNCNNKPCCYENKPPYVCNGCPKFNNCRKIRYSYSHDIAYNEYKQNLINTRANLRITKQEIADINNTISPLMIDKHHSVNHVYISHPELLPFSKSTFYKYIDLGILNVRNIYLNRRVKFKVKKEYDYMRDKIDTKIKICRFYSDFNYYMEFNSNASIVEMDTVIGKCMLTLNK